jgi:hypothetical protein
MTELLRAAEGSPLLLAFLVVGWFLSYAVERLCGSNGPAVRLVALWRDRELRRLRHEALVRAERRRLDHEAASAREADLLTNLDHLRRRVAQLTAERDELRARIERRHRLPQPRGDPDTEPLRRESAHRLVPGR